jgi:hypothetical protein
MLDANGEGLTGAAVRDDLGEKIGGVNGMESRNGLGIMRQIQPGSNSQFQHLTMEAREQICAQKPELFSRHDPIHEAGKDMVAVESHGGA